jgi:hypothetical protein
MLARGSGLEWIVRLLVTVVPVASLAGVVLLLCNAFTPQRALLIGAVFASLTAHRLAIPGFERWPATGRALLGVVLVFAVLVRLPPALYLQGGQDQGIYVAMAAHFAETGSLDIVDDLRARLHDPASLQRYDANNAGGGLYQPGMYTDAATPGHYIFQFYPVHPLWMAIFGGMFGLEHAALSQIFFALVSLLFAALLAERLTSDWRAGLLYAALLAVLPLHVFFSKFPISEMPTLAFALVGWFALSCFHETSSRNPRPIWLVIAVLCFIALFCTRISGFTYLPVVLVGALLTHLYVDDARVRRQWAMCWAFVVIGYVISVGYGLTYSYPYSHDIYTMGLGERLYAQLQILLPVLALVAVTPFLLTLAPQRRMRLREALSSAWIGGQRWIGILFIALVALGLARAGLLAFTDHYQGNPWYDIRWHASHGGMEAWRQGSLYVAAAQLSPFIALLVFFSLWQPGRSGARVLLVTMLLAMTAYTALVQWFVPYQYYYARYQLSELIPYALLVVVVRGHEWWHWPRIRSGLIAALVLSGAYFSWYTWPLVGFREGDGAHESLTRIADHLDSNDVLLFDQYATLNPHEIVTPLRFFFGKYVYTFSDHSRVLEIVHDLTGSFGDIYLATSRGTPAPAGFVLVEDTLFRESVMAHSIAIPRASTSGADLLAIYRFDAETYAVAAIQSASGLRMGLMRPNCCQGIYPDNAWTNGHATLRNVPVPSGQWHELLLKVCGYRTDYDQSDVKVSVNGQELVAKGFRDNVFTFDLGALEGPAQMSVEISSNTFVPKQRGVNEDPRELGIDIDTLRLR